MTLRLCAVAVSLFLVRMSMPMDTFAAEPAADARARKFLDDHASRIAPLERASALAWWNANITGKDEDFAGQGRRPEPARRRARRPRCGSPSSRPSRTATIADPILRPRDRRALPDLPGEAGRSRAAPEDHRQGQRHREGVQRLPRQGRRQGDDRQRGPQGPQGIRRTRPSGKAVWEASKGVGPVVEADLKELVKLRNEAARTLGFTNFHALQLCAERADARTRSSSCSTSSTTLTREPFRAAKARDRRQARRETTASRSTTCGPGTTTTRSSRRRPPSSTPTSTPPTPRPTSSSSAATSTPASACRSTT